jgi:agmatinase
VRRIRIRPGVARYIRETDIIRHTMKKPGEDWFYHTQNFGALPPELSDPESSKIFLLPVPYETSTTYGAGCRHGPGAIIEASANMELYDEELRLEPCAAGICTSAPLDTVDDAEEMIERVEAVATKHTRRDKLVTMLGGEHTVSLGMVRALHRIHPDLSVLALDAHADFRESYHGNKYSHACVGRRISELCQLVQVGIRSLSREEATALNRKKVETHWAYEFRDLRGTREMQILTERIVEKLAPHVYISIDVDVFDPSIMPAVGTPEPGGLLWDEILEVLRAVIRSKKVVGLDLVELAPVAGLVHPQFTAARLLYKIWGHVLKGNT